MRWSRAALAVFAPLGFALNDEPYVANLPTRTIIDILSSDPQFSVFLGIIRTAGLVPLINQSRNSTLLAPINAAFKTMDSMSKADVLYHFLNSTLIVEGDGADHGELIPSYLESNDKLTHAPVYYKGTTLNRDAEIVTPNLLASKERGVVHAISKVLTVPNTLCGTLDSREELTIFSQMLNVGGYCTDLSQNWKETIGGVTVFAPSDGALSQYKPLELSYLLSGYGSGDLQKFLRRHISSGIYAGLTGKVKLLDGSVMNSSSELVLNGTYMPTDTFDVALDGVIHTYDEVLGKPVFFTPEMYLLALHGYRFTRAVYLYGFEKLINGSYTLSQTILLPLHLQQYESAGYLGHNSMLFHFLDEQIHHAHSTEGPKYWLVNTKMSLIGSQHPQRMRVGKGFSNELSFNYLPARSMEYTLCNTSIYVVDSVLSPPGSLPMAVGPMLRNSHSLQFLEELGLLDLPTDRSWTLFLPTRESWEREGLVLKFLQQHHDVARAVFEKLIVSTPFYSDSQPQDVTLLNGNKGHLRVYSSKTSLSGIGFELDGAAMDSEFSDTLFNNGVAHTVTNHELPADIEISATDLIKAGDREEFLKLLSELDYDKVVQTPYNYTLFVPNLRSLAQDNITLDSKDICKLIELHILEGDAFEELLKGNAVRTLEGREVIMLEAGDDKYAVTIKGTSGLETTITAMGRTRGVKNGGTTILFLDRYLTLHDFTGTPPFLHTHTALILGVVVGVIAASLFILSLVFYTYDGHDEAEDPLLGQTEAQEEEQASDHHAIIE